MNIFSLSVFLLSCGAKVDIVSNFHEIWTSDNLDHGQWTPVIDRKDRNYEKIIYRHSSSAVENYYSQSNQQHQAWVHFFKQSKNLTISNLHMVFGVIWNNVPMYLGS